MLALFAGSEGRASAWKRRTRRRCFVVVDVIVDVIVDVSEKVDVSKSSISPARHKHCATNPPPVDTAHPPTRRMHAPGPYRPHRHAACTLPSRADTDADRRSGKIAFEDADATAGRVACPDWMPICQHAVPASRCPPIGPGCADLSARSACFTAPAHWIGAAIVEPPTSPSGADMAAQMGPRRADSRRARSPAMPAAGVAVPGLGRARAGKAGRAFSSGARARYRRFGVSRTGLAAR